MSTMRCHDIYIYIYTMIDRSLPEDVVIGVIAVSRGAVSYHEALMQPYAVPCAGIYRHELLLRCHWLTSGAMKGVYQVPRGLLKCPGLPRGCMERHGMSLVPNSYHECPRGIPVTTTG